MENRLYATVRTKTCPYRCIYCFATNPNYKSGKDLTSVSDKELKALAENNDILQPACDSELLLYPNWKELLTRMALLKKSISFATKMEIKDEDIEFLKQINQKLNEFGEILNVGVTIIKWDSYKEIEPCAPSPEKRIQTLKKLYENGIGCSLIIRPLFPDSSFSDLKKIVDRSQAFCYGYLIGPLYANDSVLQYLKQRNVSYILERKSPDWNQKKALSVIKTPELERELEKYIIHFNKKFFRSNSECVSFIREKICN